MKPNRALFAAAYLVAAGLIVVPPTETLISAWPFQLGTVSWRFGAAGLLSRGLLTSLLGLVLAGAVAFAAGHRRLLRAAAGVCLVASVLLAAGAVLLTLDAVQLRGSVGPEAKVPYDLAALGALFKTLLAALVSALMAWGGWRAGRPTAQTDDEAPARKVAFTRH